jgi:hypothetical protein
MKRIIVTSSLLLLTLISFSQNIEDLFADIKVTPELPEQYEKLVTPQVLNSNLYFTKVENVINNNDSVVVAFKISPNDSDVCAIVYFRGEYIVKAVNVEPKQGLLTIKKENLAPGDYSIVFYGDGAWKYISNFSVKTDYEAQEQIGKYLIYWNNSVYKFKYVGIEE